jgi:hypothetical protein
MGREVGGATLLWLLPFMTAYFQTQVNLRVLKPFLLGPLAQLRQVGAIERFFEHILEVVVPRKIPNLPVCSEDPRCLSRGERKRVCSEDQPS